MASHSVFLSAGDYSGDNAASRLAAELQRGYPGLSLCGLGGHRLAAAGQEQLADPEDLAVLGFWEVARRYFYFRDLMARCVDRVRRSRPDVVVLVDYPGFNLRLAARLRGLGIPVVYYIAPQVWAWGQHRVKQMRQTIDRLLVILPFERTFFSQHGITCDFVGHYLLEDMPDEYIGSAVREPGWLALLPGSRRQEVARMLPTMLCAASWMYEKYQMTAAVAAVRGKADYEAAVARYATGPVEIVYDDPRRVVAQSRLACVASGTATLETGIIGRPMVVMYKTGWITYQIAQRLVTLEQIGLVNLVLAKKVVPELIQGAASVGATTRELERFVVEDEYAAGVTRELHRVPGLLGGGGASARAAELVAQTAGWG
jgi:lipid-A-disaccharide synthase